MGPYVVAKIETTVFSPTRPFDCVHRPLRSLNFEISLYYPYYHCCPSVPVLLVTITGIIASLQVPARILVGWLNPYLECVSCGAVVCVSEAASAAVDRPTGRLGSARTFTKYFLSLLINRINRARPSLNQE